MRGLRVNKGDVILLVILAATALMYGVNEWNILHGYDQLSSSAWTTFGLVFGGELLAFALKKVGDSMAEAKRGEQAASDAAMDTPEAREGA